MTEAGPLTERLEIRDGVAHLSLNGRSADYAIQELPETFVRWQLDYKHSIYDKIERDEYVAFNQGHLPVVATLGGGSPVPNLANKGVGFTPRDEYLEQYLGLVEEAVAQIEQLPPHALDATRSLRVQTARALYDWHDMTPKRRYK